MPNDAPGLGFNFSISFIHNLNLSSSKFNLDLIFEKCFLVKASN